MHGRVYFLTFMLASFPGPARCSRRTRSNEYSVSYDSIFLHKIDAQAAQSFLSLLPVGLASFPGLFLFFVFGEEEKA